MADDIARLHQAQPRDSHPIGHRGVPGHFGDLHAEMRPTFPGKAGRELEGGNVPVPAGDAYLTGNSGHWKYCGGPPSKVPCMMTT